MELREALLNRVSVRKYDAEKQITEEQLQYILLAGMAAPISKKEYNSIKFTVIQDKEFLHKVANPTKEGENFLYGVPTLILISTKKCLVENVEYLNVSGVVENMLLAATDEGLGSIYLTSFLRKVEENDELRKELEIPGGYIHLAAVGVGQRADSPGGIDECEIRRRIEVIRK